MAKPKPRVSVIIPTYNRAQKILKPIYSVIRQTMPSWELIIIDDASTDNTKALIEPLIREHKIKYGRLPQNSGPSKARNTGMKYAEGDYSAFLDSDDAWDYSFLASMVETLDKNPHCALAYCDSKIFDLG